MTTKKKTIRRPVGARRLLKLAKFLDTVPPEKFDYRKWATGLKVTARITCGSTACALGWATQIPEFKKLGLKLVRDVYDSNGYVSLKTKGKSLDNEDAAKEFFRLERGEAEYLFFPEWNDGIRFKEYQIEGLPKGPDENATPSDVAHHIRRFVNFKWGKTV